ncbi:MAG: CoF synthetase [Microbacterium sp.]|nr:CoF synthetase [Microbacterium sp.]
MTAGENALLPLVRYRTGDFGRRVVLADGGVGIADLEGREHSVFTAADGSRIPCVDLTQQLQAHGALGWTVAQEASGAVTARVVGGDTGAISAALRALLGREVPVASVPDLAALGEGKPRRYLVAPPSPAPGP